MAFSGRSIRSRNLPIDQFVLKNIFQNISHEEIILIYRFGCLRRVTSGDVDITVLEPEELVAIRNYKLYNVLVTNELRLFPDGN